MSTTDEIDDAEVVDATEVLDALIDREPVINQLKDAQRELLFRKLGMAQTLDDDGKPSGRWVGPNGLAVADVAGMLEVAGMYGLDPFAPGEIWVSRGKPKDGEPQGKQMLMVGRDGLRKIAIRNGLEIDGDVVRAKDRFVVTRNSDRSRSIEHVYAEGDRGAIIGAWSEVYERRSGRQRGFFWAPLAEYKPEQPGYGSPWKAQVSAMIRKAAERQAISQATPLGGLIVDGEMDINLQDERRPVLGAADVERPQIEAGELAPSVAAVVERAQQLGHDGLSDAATARMATAGQPEEQVAAWVAEATADLDRFEQASTAPIPEPDPLPVGHGDPEESPDA